MLCPECGTSNSSRTTHCRRCSTPLSGGPDKSPWDTLIASRPNLTALKQEHIDAAGDQNVSQAQKKVLAAQQNAPKAVRRAKTKVPLRGPRRKVAKRASTPLPWEPEAQAQPRIRTQPVVKAKIPVAAAPSESPPQVKAKAKPSQVPPVAEPKNVVPAQGPMTPAPATKEAAPHVMPRVQSKPGLTLPPPQSDEVQEIVVSYRLAGIGRRSLALLIDASLLLVVLQMMAFAGLFGESLTSLLIIFELEAVGPAIVSGAMLNLVVSATVIGFATSLAAHVLTGRSIGEWGARLQVINRKSGARPSTNTMMIRAVMTAVSGLLFGAGFFWIIVDREFRTWQDCVTRTLVIDFQPGATSTTTEPVVPT
jgi:uncharacterized RDD family membrane protein YckC